jgi:hypothetical protein
MSTTPVDTWAVDLTNVTFIYPFVGSEFIMVVIAVILWLIWTVWQCKFESQSYREEIEKYATPENLRKATSDDQDLY